jgi:putative ABC transport system substrate-binding protein
VQAQPSGKLPTIGFLGSGTPLSQRHVAAAFVQRLRELGWTEGSNVLIAYRWAEGRTERYAQIAAEFAKLNVDVVLASGAASVAAAKQASPVTPIVFPVVNDPLGTGLIASLARPGGNITGLSLQNSDLAGKRLDILREAVPGCEGWRSSPALIQARLGNFASSGRCWKSLACSRVSSKSVTRRILRQLLEC